MGKSPTISSQTGPPDETGTDERALPQQHATKKTSCVR